MSNSSQGKLVGFFVVLGVFLALVPIMVTGGYIQNRRKQKTRRLNEDLESCTVLESWQPKSSPDTFDMLVTGRRVGNKLKAPSKAKPNGLVQSKLHSTVKPSCVQFSRTIIDVDDIPDATAKGAMADGGDVPLKRFLSTTSTLVNHKRMRAESIETANNSPLPKILPGADGYFRPLPERSLTDASRAESSRSVARACVKGKDLAEDYRQTQQTISKRDRRGKGKLNKFDEKGFEEVEL